MFRSSPPGGRLPASRATRLVLVTAVMALFLTGCTQPEAEPEPPAVEQVEVAGDFGARPHVQFDTPLAVTESGTRTVVEGNGPALAEGDLALVSYMAVSAETGEVEVSNFGSQPQTLRVSEDEAGPLYEDLLGTREGSRLLRVELGTADRPEPSVLVYDIRHTRAWGEEVDPPEGTPTVTLDESGAPSVEIPGSEPPSELEVVTLRRGDGPQVQEEMAVTVRYTAVSWESGEVVDGTWSSGEGPTTIAFTGLIEGWQNGLVDTPVGSQVMLIVPPSQAFGDDTLVYVIDVLAVSALDGTEGSAGSDAGDGVEES